MTETTHHTPGTPSWVDLGTPDMLAARRFYESLFGWEGDDQGEEAGHYTMELLRGLPVCALSPQYQEGMPPYWTTYITVDDADVTAKLVAANGGTVVAEPFDVFTAGRMAVCIDPTGAPFSLWQPGDHIGARIVNEPGTLTWNEMTVHDVDTAVRFYGAVFGWTVNELDAGAYTYREFVNDGKVIAGMVHMDDQWPADLPSHWMVYFAVADTDASAAQVSALGGTVAVPPTDIPPGRFAVCNDPTGAVFSIIKLATPAE